MLDMLGENPLKIDILIVGGSIAGLACAYALGRSGHRVHVLEKAQGPNQGAGGIRIPPNLTKILVDWGLQNELSEVGKCLKSAFISLETGELVGFLEWQEDIMREAGGAFLLMHYDDLYRILHEIALSAGAKISFGKTVASVFVDDKEVPTVLLEDGTELKSDIIVGADGTKSLVREVVTQRADDGVDSGSSFYTIIVPEESREDPELAEWVGQPVWPIAMGDRRVVWGYPVTRRNGVDYCLTIFWPDNELKEPKDVPEGWDEKMPTANINLDGFDDRVRRAFHTAKEARRVKYVRRDFVEDWVDETGKIVLIGDAAHPVIPCCIQAPSLAIEDAEVLGELFARLHSHDEIPQLLEAFQDLRQERCNFVTASEVGYAALMSLPPGAERDARDAGMRASLLTGVEQWDEGMLSEQWEQISQEFGYNAREAAEEWWLKWGMLGDRSRDSQILKPLHMVFEVTERTSPIDSD